MRTFIVKTSFGEMLVTLVEGGGSCICDFKLERNFRGLQKELDILTSFVLALAANGFDVESESFRCSLETTIEALGNH